MISIFDMFKIGIGPSSLHTVGPMRAGILFRKQLIKQGLLDKIARFSANVYGSLSLHYTGKNHGTDHSIIGSLAGYEPDTLDTTASPNSSRKYCTAKPSPKLAATTPRLTTNVTSCSILPSATRKRRAPGNLYRR